MAQISPDATFNFENANTNKLPADWTAVTSTWTIVKDGTSNSMKQAGKSKGEQFNICIQNKLYYQNLNMDVRIKPLEGKEDQGGGLVWRYHDAKNYYITRANPLENNFKVYKVVKGIRKEIKSAKVKIKPGDWYTLKVVMVGYTMDCYLNGQKLLSASDTTFPNAGQIGFWSKADAVTLFDDLEIKNLH
jgi:hypothetical protein